jgi:hypothetical protein
VLSVSLVDSDAVERIAQRTADVYRSLPPERRERTVMIGESYIVAAYIDGYGSRYQLPQAYSTNRSYGYFPPPPDDRDSALFIGRDPGAFRPYFATVCGVGDVGDDMHAYLLTGQRKSWAEMWPQLRTLTVS